jgi:Domain of unknown function (DUF1929)/Glyoxal oxidase N-terminus
MGPLKRGSFPAIAAIPLIAVFSFVVTQHAISANLLTMVRQASDLLGITDETDVPAPVDYGAGPGVTPTSEKTPAASAISSQIPVGGGAANVTGVFGAAVTWPIIPIHVVLLPDGRVMNYGTDQSGQQGAQLIYDIWDPTLGTGTSAHTVLPNSTGTDIFCSSQSVMLSGNVLISGGDLTINGVRNFAQNHTNVFSPTANTLTSNTPMHYARWYDSLVSLPDGHLAVFGGRQNVVTITPPQPATTPEEYDPATKVWTSLTGATSTAAFSNNNNWYYPRAYVAPGGDVFVLGLDGTMYSISTAGVGSITQYATSTSGASGSLPTIPFAPGKVLSLRGNQEVDVVNFSGSVPLVTQTDGMDQVRYWASGTVLADGKVLVTGGSTVDNVETGVAYQAQIWDPATGHWTGGASATKPRLYHSNSMLLPDATVLTGGGGAPGPVINLNAEVYYPPYLYASNGAAAVRPAISAVTPRNLNPGGTITMTVGPTDTISRLTFIRTGSATHSNNSDQRFITLPFTQTGQNLTTVLPSDPTVLLPGYYMLFAFNQAGVPSRAKIIAVVQTYTLLPTSLAFGNQLHNTSSAPQTLTLTNTDTVALPINSISLGGTNPSQFSQSNNCGTSIAIGASCTIHVIFTPARTGIRTAKLKVAMGGGAGSKSSTLTGTGT